MGRCGVIIQTAGQLHIGIVQIGQMHSVEPHGLIANCAYCMGRPKPSCIDKCASHLYIEINFPRIISLTHKRR